MSRPTRIDQIVPSIVGRDAVSFHYLQAQRVIRSLGFVSEIYAATMGPEMATRARSLTDLPRHSSRQWVCYQASIGSPAADVATSHPGAKIIDYHNITPPAFVEKWMPSLAEELRLGREQVAAMAPIVSLALADSAYNASELEAWHYGRTAVSTLMLDRSNFDVEPDPAELERLGEERCCGGADWLFVGQMLPHKSHHDVVMAFAAYLRAYDPAARLHLVGRKSCPSYAKAIALLSERLGISKAVRLHGSVGAAELVALYHSCDVYVCCSEHEGLGAPLVEAMHHGLPIVAFAAGAVPETVGDAAVLLGSKEPALIAAAAHSVTEDPRLREAMAEKGRARATAFMPECARAQFAESIRAAVDELAPV